MQYGGSPFFFPALGSLHAYKIKAELVGRYHSGCYVSAKNLLKTFTTVRFEKGSDGMLNAKTAALKNGVTDNPPTGLFANKKAARRALSSWAETYGLCPVRIVSCLSRYPSGRLCRG